MEKFFSDFIIEVVEGDITLLACDAIVNAANKELILGGGVAGAIRERGGDSIQEECNKIGGTFVGGAVITTAGNLKAKFVIHAVGPRMGDGNEDEKLKNATINSIKVAEESRLRSIAFPAISSGIFGFPIERCAKVMLGIVKEELQKTDSLKRVTFCLYGERSYEIFKSELERL